MKNLDLAKHTVGSLSRLIKRREISPVELAMATLERINNLDGRLKTFVTLMEPQAIQAAKDAERAIMTGNYLGSYHGIPVGVKDLFYTKGVRTTASSKVLADFIPDYDATMIARLKSAGAVIVGKTNTHEFAWGLETPPTRNPWDIERIPGGSSGGSGAAVAASLCVAATGTDTGGSIRVPAALNGVVGLKPTFGRVSKYGVITLSWSFDHAGPITKTVEDAAMMMNIVAGYDVNDACSADVPVPDYTEALKGNISGVRLGIPKEYFFDPLDPEVAAAFEKAISVLKSLGASIHEVTLPKVNLTFLSSMTIQMPESSSYHEQWMKTKAHLYSPEVLGYLKWGEAVPASLYVKAQRIRRLICNDFDVALKKVDAIVVPSLPVTAPKVGEHIVTVGKSKEMLTQLLTRNMLPLNAAGLPAISLPCGFSLAGLPIGLQIISRSFDESGIIKIANNYEKNTDWHLRRPSL